MLLMRILWSLTLLDGTAPARASNAHQVNSPCTARGASRKEPRWGEIVALLLGSNVISEISMLGLRSRGPK